ncbi:MAG: hypothetical protein RLZZ450_69 [Pseudomonadota bacterium]|jgi:hypothetical protein
MLKVKTKVKEKGPGFAKLISELAGGTITIGVQGEEATMQHPNTDLSVGELAAVHELGLGVKERSWLRSWFDQNQARIQAETRAALAQVAVRRVSRKQALEELGYRWTDEIRENIQMGRITPPLAQATIDAKGHDIPLLESGVLMNSITFRLFLSQIKSVADPSLRAALRAGVARKKKTPGVRMRQHRQVRSQMAKAANLLWMWRKLRKALTQKRGSDFRNHGFKNSGRGGLTGRAGFPRR